GATRKRSPRRAGNGLWSNLRAPRRAIGARPRTAGGRRRARDGARRGVKIAKLCARRPDGDAEWTRFDALLGPSQNSLPLFGAGAARRACLALQSPAGRRPAVDADAVDRAHANR